MGHPPMKPLLILQLIEFCTLRPALVTSYQRFDGNVRLDQEDLLAVFFLAIDI